MQSVQRVEAGSPRLLTAAQVQNLLGVDRSTVYRMAADGRLFAVKVGSQWRFPADRLDEILAAPTSPVPGLPARPSPVPAEIADAVIETAAQILGVMMVVTDMEGHALTEVANPCAWFASHTDDPDQVAACTHEWRSLADDVDMRPQFRDGALGFQCARSHIRVGSSLVGMVLAGGVADDADPAARQRGDLYHLDAAGRDRVTAALPRIAAVLSRITTRHTQGSTG